MLRVRITPKMSVRRTAIRKSYAAYIAPAIRKPRKPDMSLPKAWRRCRLARSRTPGLAVRVAVA